MMFLSNEKYIIVVKCMNYFKPTQTKMYFKKWKDITVYEYEQINLLIKLEETMSYTELDPKNSPESEN